MASRNSTTRAISKQDLIAARAELKQFRRDVALLKKKHLLNKKYDARSILPTKYLKGELKKFADVLTGKAQPVKVSTANKKYYAEKGYLTKGSRVVVPIQANEKAYASHGDVRIKATGTGGSIVKIDLKLNRNNINTWADQLREVGIRLKADEVLTFQFYGNNSHAAFENLHRKTAWEAMADYIQNYPAFDYAENNDPDKQQDFIDNVTVFKIKRDANGKFSRPEKNYLAKERTEEQRRRDSIRNQQRYERRLNNMTEKQEAGFHKEKAERERARRKFMREHDGDALTAYRDQAKARRKASDAKRKAKKQEPKK